MMRVDSRSLMSMCSLIACLRGSAAGVQALMYQEYW